MRRLVPLLLLCAAVPTARAAVVDQCRWPPPGGSAVAPWADEVMVTPAVGDLDGDGLPEIVFVSFDGLLDVNTGRDGILRIIRGSDCSEVASSVDPGCVTCFGEPSCGPLEEQDGPGVLCSSCAPAIADLDGDGFMEIVALSEGDGTEPEDARRLVIYDHQGQFLRCSPAPPHRVGYLTAPAIADLDGDGSPEIGGRATAWGADGSIRFAQPEAGLGLSTFADVDGDGTTEMIAGERVLRADGSVLWERLDLQASWPSVADFDGDCRPEVVLVAPKQARLAILEGATGAIRCDVILPGGLTSCPLPRPEQGGAPTLADVDGDCIPEIGVAGCLQYAFYRYDPSAGGGCMQLLWQAPTSDPSSRITCSTIFDLEGDGRFEVLYNDEQTLWVFDALTGFPVHVVPNTTNTLVEYPVVADVDGDGRAEIVVPANNYATPGTDTGLRVLHDPAVPWQPARPLYNQHAYHVTNMLDDGSVPVFEEPSWSAYNGYRAQRGPTSCEAPCALAATCSVLARASECSGAVAAVRVAGSVDADPAAGPIRHEWTTDCPGGEFLDASLLSTELFLDGPPPCPVECTVTLSVSTGWGETSSCTSAVTVSDTLAPSLSGVPADETVECGPVPPPATVTASDACDTAPSLVAQERTEPGPCPQSFRVVRTWTATDACGNTSSAQQAITVRDTRPPSLSGVPADETVECGPVPPPATVTASDLCDPRPGLGMQERTEPGPCPQSFRVVRTWTATDACGNTSSAQQAITVRDTRPPSLSGVPADETYECPDVPPLPAVRATDACDPAPGLAFREVRADGSCPGNYTLTRTWTATDACGNTSSAQQVATVRDSTPPTLVGVPADASVECDAVPPPPVVTALDACGPVPPVDFREARVDGSCPNEYQLVRTWEARDACGNVARARQVVSVVDTTPPRVTASGEPVACLWPPNHWYVCLSADALSVAVEDNCPGAASWRIVACESDQPDDANGVGDGHTTNDCVVSPDGRGVCARSERNGTVPAGRHYGILVVAQDACGNESAPALAGKLYVPHDQSPHEKDCLNPTKVGHRLLPGAR